MERSPGLTPTSIGQTDRQTHPAESQPGPPEVPNDMPQSLEMKLNDTAWFEMLPGELSQGQEYFKKKGTTVTQVRPNNLRG